MTKGNEAAPGQAGDGKDGTDRYKLGCIACGWTVRAKEATNRILASLPDNQLVCPRCQRNGHNNPLVLYYRDLGPDKQPSGTYFPPDWSRTGMTPPNNKVLQRDHTSEALFQNLPIEQSHLKPGRAVTPNNVTKAGRVGIVVEDETGQEFTIWIRTAFHE